MLMYHAHMSPMYYHTQTHVLAYVKQRLHLSIFGLALVQALPIVVAMPCNTITIMKFCKTAACDSIKSAASHTPHTLTYTLRQKRVLQINIV